ncbi:MAG: class I SAM-dependent methyltransferase [Anaerolineae bacterium]
MEQSEGAFIRAQYETDANLQARIALHAQYSTNPLGWYNWIWQHLALEPGMRVLEAGGGDGAMWRGRIEGLPSGCRLLLTDLSLGMVSSARSVLAEMGITYAVADAQSLPVASESCDLVVANHMLYHVPDRAAALGEIARVLRPSGRLCASTVGEGHVREMHEWLAAVCPAAAVAQALHLPAFTLQSGAEELAALFPSVTRADYVDNLVVDSVEPVVAYMLSSWSALLGEQELRALRSILSGELRSSERIVVHKESGLFMAHKG